MLDPRLLLVCVSQFPNNPSEYVVRAYKKPLSWKRRSILFQTRSKGFKDLLIISVGLKLLIYPAIS